MTKGMVRSIDSLGRIVIPKEYRKLLGITSKDKLEITINEDVIEIKKYNLDDAFLKIQNLYYKALNSIYPDCVFFCTMDAIYLYDKKKKMKDSSLFRRLIGVNDILYVNDSFILDNRKLYGYYLIPLRLGEEVIGYIVIVTKEDDLERIKFVDKLVNS